MSDDFTKRLRPLLLPVLSTEGKDPVDVAANRLTLEDICDNHGPRIKLASGLRSQVHEPDTPIRRLLAREECIYFPIVDPEDPESDAA